MPLDPAIWNTFLIRQGTKEPGAFSIGMGTSARVITGFLPSEDFLTIIQTGIETAGADNVTGRINRVLPVANPEYPWLFLRNIDNAQGVTFTEKVTADPEGILEAPSLPYYADYQYVEFQAKFEQRMYALLDDSTLNPIVINYFDEDGNPQVKNGWTEWWRYVLWQKMPSAEYLTADKGQMQFSVPGGGGAPDPTDGAPAGREQIRMLIPTSAWKVTWYAVPYGYVLSDNSFFDRFIGHVNQFTWVGFLPGNALLQAVNVVNVYPPPFPGFETYAGYEYISQEKLCDIELIILEAKRTAQVPVTPVNPNHIAAGHNLIPYALNRKFYYAESGRGGGAPGTGFPIYPSVPFELLFQNPDSP